ncbi:MAG: hypothetical protein WBG47_15300 [Gordonia sp. (in: high G+C Gram-positive bacteria)]|uniref:ImmA/IrrE family metallo-endopeptidase n=1 Tax=Gordonia sp. (in: high G+C Gram-positive bacteria) TaxID=84139 RepID=UPI003C76074C
MATQNRSNTPRRSHRRVHAAVDAVLDVASQKHANSLEEIVYAVGESRRRDIKVTVDDLAPGVWGQRREYDSYDEIILAKSLPSEARTLAHELGHIVFRHPGNTTDSATEAAEDDLIAYMLGLASSDSDTDTDTEPLSASELALQEWEAEAFAAQLLQRLSHLDRSNTWRPMLRYDEAFG